VFSSSSGNGELEGPEARQHAEVQSAELCQNGGPVDCVGFQGLSLEEENPQTEPDSDSHGQVVTPSYSVHRSSDNGNNGQNLVELQVDLTGVTDLEDVMVHLEGQCVPESPDQISQFVTVEVDGRYALRVELGAVRDSARRARFNRRTGCLKLGFQETSHLNAVAAEQSALAGEQNCGLQESVMQCRATGGGLALENGVPAGLDDSQSIHED